MKKMKISATVLIVLSLLVLSSSVVLAGGNGFDEFGYNYQARIFVGTADGVDRNLDGKLWGDPTYANDRVVMKWSKAWDDARFHGALWTCDAWEDNEWNGNVPGGSGETWHYKIVWVGPELENSPCWREGGYAIWGQFEVIFSQGTVANEHFWDVHTMPAGFGGY
jgi:hypothetical protein